jgi:hypothetical protein
MKLATFNARTGDRVGIVDGDEVIDLTAAHPSLATMIDLLNREPSLTRQRWSPYLAPGEVFTMTLAGRRRLRDPLTREPDTVARDVQENKVSAQAARALSTE